MSEVPESPNAPQYENIGSYYDSWEAVEADLRRLDGDSTDSMNVLDLETAISAAKEFYATGGLYPQLKWDRC